MGVVIMQDPTAKENLDAARANLIAVRNEAKKSIEGARQDFYKAQVDFDRSVSGEAVAPPEWLLGGPTCR